MALSFVVTGVVCLQGGGEFSAGCRPMDQALLQRTPGRVVVTALAGAVGSDYRTATANGVRHFRGLGGTDVVAAPDVREQPVEALDILRTARLLVLPGGSPARLLTALTTTGVDAVLRDLLAAGGAVMGSSAGAMVLGTWTVLPERRGGHGPTVAAGLDVVPGFVMVPHWSARSGRADWLRAIRERAGSDVQILGLPEESGVVVDDDGMTSVGRSSSWLADSEQEIPVGTTWRRA